MLGPNHFGLKSTLFWFPTKEEGSGTGEAGVEVYNKQSNGSMLCLLDSLSLYDLYGFIGEEFQEVLAS